MKKAIILGFILIGVALQAQDVRKSNWQAIEAPYGVSSGAAVYYFIINGDSVQSTNRKGTKDYGLYKIGKVYTHGNDSWTYSLGQVDSGNLIHAGKDTIIYEAKNSFTGKWTRITYILKNQ